MENSFGPGREIQSGALICGGPRSRPMSQQASPSQISERRLRAEAALAQLRNGADFAGVAAEFSDASDAMEGGLLDWRPGTQLTKKFAEILAPMKPGEITPVIQTQNGLHILKLVDRRNQKAGATMVDQTHARHILVKISELTSEADARRRIIELKERLDHGGKFEELAKLHSEDASASSGGDLGWVSPGDTVPEFENAMKTLKPGQISEPVQTPFGWHLIQVLEHRTDRRTRSQKPRRTSPLPDDSDGKRRRGRRPSGPLRCGGRSETRACPGRSARCRALV